VPRVVADPASLWRLVDQRTALESCHLIAFLAGVDDLDRRGVLVAETVSRLHALAVHRAPVLRRKVAAS
jgi:hypothetical protein